jgi:hypothetical protein
VVSMVRVSRFAQTTDPMGSPVAREAAACYSGLVAQNT